MSFVTFGCGSSAFFCRDPCSAGASFAQVIAFVIASSRLQIELDGDFTEWQMVAKKCQQVSLIRRWEALWLIANQNDRRWQAGNLRCVVDLGAFQLKQRWFVTLDGCLDQSVQLTCRNALVCLLE